MARAQRQYPRESTSSPIPAPRSTPPLTPPPSPPHAPIELSSEYAHLRKLLAPTYRGRLLKEVHASGDGQTRYIDESAVFVGRVVKERESEVSLFQRFAKYGPVVSRLSHGKAVLTSLSVRSSTDRRLCDRLTLRRGFYWVTLSRRLGRSGTR